MKITHPDLKHKIILKENVSQLFVIENPNLFRNYIEDLLLQCGGAVEGRFVLSEKDNILYFEKNAFLCLSPYDIDINDKKILLKLYSTLKELAYSEDNYILTNTITTEIERYLAQMADNSEYPIEYEANFDITGVFKLAGIRIQKNYDSVLEKIIDYIEIMQKMFHINIFLFVNLKSYLSDEEFMKLYDIMGYKKFYIILIESHVPESILETEQLYIIDKSLCEIY